MLKKRQGVKWTLDSQVIVNHIKYDRDVIWYSKRGHLRLRTMDYLYLLAVLKILNKHLNTIFPLNNEELELIKKNVVTLRLLNKFKKEVYFRNLINKQNKNT
jgi:hypothetical protein